MGSKIGDGEYRLAIVVSFICGVALGYKMKEWRLRWVKFRRDRLAKKLAEAQKRLDLAAQ